MGWIIAAYIIGGIVGLVVNILLCVSFATFAEEKGYSRAKYFWICFFFGVIGYAWVGGLPDAALSYKVSELEIKVEKLERKLTESQQQVVLAEKNSGHVVKEVPVVTSPKVENNATWVCNMCSTENSVNYGQCKKCGKFRS